LTVGASRTETVGVAQPVRIAARGRAIFLLVSLGFVAAGVSLLVWPPDRLETLTPLFQIASIALGVAGLLRWAQLTLQRVPIVAADAHGISIDGGLPIPWAQVATVEQYQYEMRGTHRGLLIRLRDRAQVARRQLGTFFTRVARRGTPGDIFIPEPVMNAVLESAIADINALRPR
jgi:hypothetical protein